MTNMKAIIIDTPSGVINNSNDLKISTIEKPKINDDDVLVKIEAFGVNRMDLLQAKGLYPLPPQAPKTLGVEFSGSIVEKGENVRDFELGTDVCGLAYGGAYAQYIAVNSSMIVKKPTSISHVQAAGIFENYLTAHQALVTIGNIQEGQDVLIHAAASGVGLAAIQLAKFYGARNVFATAGSDEKLNVLKELKLAPTHCINYRTQKFDEEILKSSQGVNIIVDMVGQSYFNSNLNSLAKDGKLVMLGVLSGMQVDNANLGPIIFKRLQIQGSTLRSRSVEYQGELLQDFKSKALSEVGNQFDLKIFKVFNWSDISKAHQCMESNENIGKIVVTTN